MICGCVCNENSMTHADFRDSVRWLPYEGFSGIPKPVSFDSPGGEKNDLRCVRHVPPFLLRPQAAPRAGPFLRGHAYLPGDRSAVCVVPELRQGETGTTVLVGRQSVLHQAIRLLRRSPVPGVHHQGRCQGIASGLENGQRTRQAVHARAVAPDWNAGPKDHWN